ncbi:hypothetical protein IHE44_0009885, partial [Lamprotornis superbus]
NLWSQYVHQLHWGQDFSHTVCTGPGSVQGRQSPSVELLRKHGPDKARARHPEKETGALLLEGDHCCCGGQRSSPLPGDPAGHLPFLAAYHSMGEASFEHTVELQGITFNSSLQMENSDYYRVLTPALERLFLSSLQDSQLNWSCTGCTILGYSRNGNSGVIVHFRLLFTPQDSQPLNSTLEEEALRHGLAAALHKQGFSLAAYGTISSASLTGMALLPLPCAGAAATQGHTAKPLLVLAKLLQALSSGCLVKASCPAAVLEMGVLPGTQQSAKMICLAPSRSSFTRQQQEPA